MKRGSHGSVSVFIHIVVKVVHVGSLPKQRTNPNNLSFLGRFKEFLIFLRLLGSLSLRIHAVVMLIILASLCSIRQLLILTDVAIMLPRTPAGSYTSPRPWRHPYTCAASCDSKRRRPVWLGGSSGSSRFESGDDRVDVSRGSSLSASVGWHSSGLAGPQKPSINAWFITTSR